MSANTRPVKRSRIVASEPAPETPSTSSHSDSATPTPCSDNNARHLAHTVTLRPLRQQKVAHTLLHHPQQTMDTSALEEFGDLDFGADVDGDGENNDEGDGEEVETPKRRVVCISFELKTTGTNFGTGSTMPRLAPSSESLP